MAHATHVKKSRKKIPERVCGIEGGIPKGSSYYWWKFRRGGKHYSLTPPRRSQLTQSGFYATLWDIEDDTIAKSTTDTIVDDIESVKSELSDLGDECQSSLDNMPEGLQQGDTGQLLEERVQWCSEKSDEVGGIDVDEDSTEEEKQAAIEELQGIDFTDAP